MADKNVFDGSDVTDAIRKACATLGVTQAELDIEVVRTGTSGIFGLMRRSAQIKVSRKGDMPEQEEGKAPDVRKKGAARPATASRAKEKPAAPARAKERPAARAAEPIAPAGPIDPAIFRAVEAELGRIVELMGFPATIIATQEDDKVLATITGDHVDEIVGPEGQTLDALQFLVRKIISRRFPGRVLVTLDAGSFREVRRQGLTEEAIRLADEVKESGKTKMMPPLNPAERRIVHMALQQDTTIRSRSVGDGIFKKVLIYLPGQGGKKGSRRQRPAASVDEE